MKLKPGVIIRKVDEEYILIDSGEVEPKFNGMIKFNPSSFEIVSILEKEDLSIDELISRLENEYEINKEEISAITHLINELKTNNIIL